MSKKYKVGDKIVEFGEIYRIFKIDKKKQNDGSVEEIIHYKPLSKIGNASTIICSIPLSKVDQTAIRDPLTKEQFTFFLKELQEIKVEIFNDINEARSALKSNTPLENLTAIKALKKESTTVDYFNKNKTDLLNFAIEKVALEFSLVFNTSLQKAKDKINLYI